MNATDGAILQQIFPPELWRRKRLRPSASLFHVGQAANAIFIVLSGAVRLEHVQSNGERVQYPPTGPGGVIGETSFFAGAFACDGLAQGATEVAYILRRDVLAHVRDKPEAGLALARLLSDQVVRLRERIELMQLRSAKARVFAWLRAQHLAACAGDRGKALVLQRPWLDIAADLGLTHEAVYRALAALAQERRIWRQGRAVRLLR